MNDMDELLKRVLTSEEKPGYAFRRRSLERKIMEQVKETESMGQKKKMRISAAIAAAAMMAAVSVTAVAAWQYRSAADVAEEVGDGKLAGYFEEQIGNSADSEAGAAEAEKEGEQPSVGESQRFGGYEVTFLGMVSGEGLSEYARRSGEEVLRDRTYCVVAIRKEDGTAMEPGEGSFFVSPLISGLDPIWYNAASFGGNFSEFVEGGVLYRLVECDNVTCFADRELYLCVTDTLFYDKALYSYDQESGRLTRNEAYQGLNALFGLEVDASLADEEKARQLIAAVDASMEENTQETETEIPQAARETEEWMKQITPQNIEQFCVQLDNTVQVMTPDQEGYVTWESRLLNEAVSETDECGGGKIAPELFFEDGPGMVIYMYSSSEKGMEELKIQTLTLNEDGTVTFAVWVPREGNKYCQ